VSLLGVIAPRDLISLRRTNKKQMTVSTETFAFGMRQLILQLCIAFRLNVNMWGRIVLAGWQPYAGGRDTYAYVNKLYRHQTDVTQNFQKHNVRAVLQRETKRRK
jgi:hypothetical protein